MPHKRNPIASENITGLSRLLRGFASAALENVALWHERDISHSSVERVAIPDATLLLDFGLARMMRLVADLIVDTERMQANLDSTQGLVFSQAVLLALVENGHSRDAAYQIVQRNAMHTWDEGGTLEEHLAADADVDLTPADLAACFSTERFLGNSGIVFDRLESVSLLSS